MTRKDRLRKLLHDSVRDAVSNVLYYDRKEDEEMDREDVQEMFTKGWVTADDLVKWWTDEVGVVTMREFAPNGGKADE